MNARLLIGMVMMLSILSLASSVDERSWVYEVAGKWTNWEDCNAACKAMGPHWSATDSKIKSKLNFMGPAFGQCGCKIPKMIYFEQKGRLSLGLASIIGAHVKN